MGSTSIWHWLIVLIIIFVCIIPNIFYIKTYQRVSRIINSRGGNGPVGSAWLILVPVISIPWFFVLLIKMKESISISNIELKQNSWWTFGLISGILYILTFAIGFISDYIVIILSISWTLFAILHWIELSKLGRTISNS